MKKYYLIIVFVCSSIYALAQDGLTWNMGMNISTNTYGNMQPRVSVDGKGRPLVVWGRMSDQSVFFSRFNGTAFTTPVKLNPSWLAIATASWMGPDIASHGDTVYVVVKRTPEVTSTNRMYIFTSFNGGTTFNAPVELGFIADSVSRFPTVTTDATGNPIVAYMKFNSSFMDSRWVVSKSSDYGKTFSIDVKASGWGNSGEVCDCCPGAIVSSQTTTAMLYRDNNKNIRDIWTGVSNNDAATFSNGFGVDKNKWMVMSCPSSGPDGVILGDTLYSTFMSGGSGSYRTYLSKSSISSGTTASVTNLTGSISGLSQQNYPRIATDGTAMAIVWKQTVSGAAQLPFLFTNNIANGLDSVYGTVDLNDITNTDVAMSNGNLFVVWQDDNSGTVKFRSGIYSQSTTGLDEVTTSDVSVYPNPTTDELNITLPDNMTFSATIVNSLGEAVYSEQATSKLKLRTSNFANGLYFVYVISQNKIFTEKFIKW